MDQALKNRLVGVGVLMAVAVVVLPLLFDGANQQALLADTRMPPPPDVPEPGALLAEPPAQLPEAEEEITRDHVPAEPEPPAPVVAPVAVAPSATSAPEPGAPSVTPVVAPPAAPAADTRLAAMAEAWDVQVAALSAADGAERLRGKLQQSGYKARIVQRDGRYKVVVGPVLRREDAEALRGKLAADARVGKPAGMLVRYVP